jgi:carbon monoxide dehydrogenase subunit G
MKLESSFSVRAPIDEVWAALLDVERVAPCVPGAHVLERRHEDVYELQLDVELGAAPVVSCQGQLAIVDQRAEDRRAVLNLTAESAGDARAVALLELSLVADGDLTAGSVAADLSLSGAAAAFDHGEIRAAADRLVDSFARNLAALLGGGVPTVNGADPASSSAGTPAALGGDQMPAMQSILGASAAPGPEAGEAPATGALPVAEDEPAGRGAARPEPAEPPSGDGAGDGGWAGATRQAGATIERLRSPLGAVLLGLVIVAALIGGLRRARDRALGPRAGSAV